MISFYFFSLRCQVPVALVVAEESLSAPCFFNGVKGGLRWGKKEHKKKRWYVQDDCLAYLEKIGGENDNVWRNTLQRYKSCFKPTHKHLRWWSSWLWHPAVMGFQSLPGCRRFDSAPTDDFFFTFFFILPALAVAEKSLSTAIFFWTVCRGGARGEKQHKEKRRYVLWWLFGVRWKRLIWRRRGWMSTDRHKADPGGERDTVWRSYATRLQVLIQALS